jgi:hypothetical protein
VGLDGSGSDLKLAVGRGTSSLGIAAVVVASTKLATATLGLATTGTARKVAVTGAVCPVGLSNTGTARKTIATNALAALAITGTGTEVKFFPPARPWPPRALSVVLTHSDLADTELTRSYQATVDLI